MAGVLRHNAYGKSAVRLTKVVRGGDGVHELFEIDADVLLEGDFAAAYTAGDNRNVVATDTIRNFVYVQAKRIAFTTVEQFALALARELVGAYPRVARATVELTQAVWRRIDVDGRPHPHAFVEGGRHRRHVKVVQPRGGAAVLTGGVRDLLVLKTTGSEWRDFHRDAYRTLNDTSDRILATRIDADWTFDPAADFDFDVAYTAITGAILETFATRYSLGVQQTIMHLGEAALAACPAVASITLTLPNRHRIPFNLEPFGLPNENDIFVTTDEPYGLITGTIVREGN